MIIRDPQLNIQMARCLKCLCTFHFHAIIIRGLVNTIKYCQRTWVGQMSDPYEIKSGLLRENIKKASGGRGT